MHSCAPQVCSSQTPFVLFSIFCLLGIWVGFRVLNYCCDFSQFLEALTMQRRGAMLGGGVHMSNTNCNSRYLVLVRLLVTNQVCNIFEVEIVLT